MMAFSNADKKYKPTSRDNLLRDRELSEQDKMSLLQTTQIRLNNAYTKRSSRSSSTRKNRHFQNKSFRSHDEELSPDVNSIDAHQMIQELTPAHLKRRPPPNRSAGRHQNHHKLENTHPQIEPPSGFKSLYQLSLMLGKGFSIEDLYLMQDNLCKGSNPENWPVPYNLMHPPVTVTAIRPQSPSSRYEPLTQGIVKISPSSTVSQMSPKMLDEKLSEKISSRISILAQQSGIAENINASELQYALALEQEMNANNWENNYENQLQTKLQSDVYSVDPYSELIDPTYSSELVETNSSVPSSHRQENVDVVSGEEFGSDEDEDDDDDDDYYLDLEDGKGKDYEQTVDYTEQQSSQTSLAQTFSSSTFDPKLKDFNKPDSSPRSPYEKIVMFSYQQRLSPPQSSGGPTSSEDSTKAIASLSSRVGLQDFASEERSTTQLSSEGAHPVSCRVTPRTCLRTYEQAFGRDNSKKVQRSHTFSGLETKTKKGKERLAVSFPTMYYH